MWYTLHTQVCRKTSFPSGHVWYVPIYDGSVFLYRVSVHHTILRSWWALLSPIGFHCFGGILVILQSSWEGALHPPHWWREIVLFSDLSTSWHHTISQLVLSKQSEFDKCYLPPPCGFHGQCKMSDWAALSPETGSLSLFLNFPWHPSSSTKRSVFKLINQWLTGFATLLTNFSLVYIWQCIQFGRWAISCFCQ